jgi:hypothetical protein
MVLTKLNKILATILLLNFCLLIPVFYNVNGVTDPFSFWHMAYLKSVLFSDHLIPNNVYNPSYLMGSMMIMADLIKIIAIDPTIFQFLPINGIALIFAYIYLCKKFSNSIIAIFLTTILMLNTTTPTEFITTWPHAYGYLLFIFFISVYLDLVQYEKIHSILLLIILYISISFMSYTAEIWSICFALFINLCIFLFSKPSKKSIKLRPHLFLVFLVITLGFNKAFYSTYLPHGRFLDSLIESSNNFLFYGNLFHPIEIGEYIYRAEPNNLLSITTYGYISFIVFIVLICISLQAKNVFNNYQDFDKVVSFQLALLFITIADMIGYAMRGILTFRYIYFIFPLLLLISLNLTDIYIFKKYKLIILAILVAFIVSHTMLSWQDERTISSSPNQYMYLENSADWIINHSINKLILTDLLTGNKFLLQSVSKGTYLERTFWDAKTYGLIVEATNNGDNRLRNLPPYVVININIKKIYSLEWGVFKPFKNYIYKINSNKLIDKIYDDSKILIYDTTK